MSNRVDALVCAWKVNLNADACNALDTCADPLNGSTSRGLNIGGVSWSLKPSRNSTRIALERDGVRGIYDPTGPNGWNLELVARSTYLAQSPLGRTIGELDDLAACWGEVEERRLRRFDMAADFTGWPLRSDDHLRIVKTRCRTARIASFMESLERKHGKKGTAGGMRTYWASADRVTGYVVAPGNPVMLRIYDKCAELRMLQDEIKKLATEGVWSQKGWIPGEPVTRVEFQLRGPVLDELKARDPYDLPDKLQPIWRYLAGAGKATKPGDPDSGWIRLKGKTREIDPRWKCLRGLDWSGPETVAERTRQRSAVPFRAALGNVLSYLGGRGALAGIGGPDMPDVDPYLLDSAPAHERERVIRRVMKEIARSFETEGVRELLEDYHGASFAVCRPLEVAARFDAAGLEEDPSEKN